MPKKMYIFVKEEIPLGIAMSSVAHASLACYLKFQEDPNMKEWLLSSFRKVICKVSNEEFEKLKNEGLSVVLTESSLRNQEISIAFCPREEWPDYFKSFTLYGTSKI